MAEISLAPLVLGMEMSMMKDGIVAGISAIQPIFTGGQIYLGNKLTEIGTEISKYQLKQTEDEIILTVNQYYFNSQSIRLRCIIPSSLIFVPILSRLNIYFG